MTNISQKTGQHFLFILDDRDALFHMSFCTPKDQDAYLLFLKSLLKDKVYAELTLALLFTKEAIPADIQEYAAVSMQLYTKDEIYSTMVVYGLLIYANDSVFIPNKEPMNNYASMMNKK